MSNVAGPQVFEELEGWTAQFEDLAAKGAALAASCASFGMESPSFDGLPKLEADIKEAVESWELLRAWGAALGEVAAKSWIEFRANVFELADLGAAWGEKAKERIMAGHRGLVTDYLTDQVPGCEPGAS